MNTDTQNKIESEVTASEFFNNLPAQIAVFTLHKPLTIIDDKFVLFTYDNAEIHRSLSAYFHEETAEFKIRVSIGLNEFCLTDFFAKDFDHYIELLNNHLDDAVKNLVATPNLETDPFIRDLHLNTWSYSDKLPAQVDGFELFIKPTAPVKFTNGSYIILNYSNFDTNCDFSIFYNFYSNQFSGESRINRLAHVSYAFDATTLDELREKLDSDLIAELKSMS